MIPRKEINVVSDMAKWKRSQVQLRAQGRLLGCVWCSQQAEQVGAGSGKGIHLWLEGKELAGRGAWQAVLCAAVSWGEARG